MVKIFEGKFKGKNVRIAIIASKFNEFITKRLVEACIKELSKNKVQEKCIKVFWVPGAFEIPLLAKKMANKKNIDAVICLGSVIRGETYHFELVAQCAAKGIAKASFYSGKPVIFGVLSTDTVDQAYKRSEEKGDNKGRDAALAALEMIDLISQTKKI